MARRGKEDDPRVRRSKRDLTDALEKLLAEKSFEDVHVRDIIDTAMVSKNTFYNNFRDKEALLEAVFVRRARSLREAVDPERRIAEGQDPDHVFEEGLRHLVHAIGAEERTLVRIVRNDSSKTFYWAFKRFLQKAAWRFLSSFGTPEEGNVDPDVLSCFLAGGFANIVYTGLSSDRPLDEEGLLKNLLALTRPFRKKEDRLENN